eukprot:g31245.t1
MLIKEKLECRFIGSGLQETAEDSEPAFEMLHDEPLEFKSSDKCVALTLSLTSSSFRLMTVHMLVSIQLTLYMLPWVWKYLVDFI